MDKKYKFSISGDGTWHGTRFRLLDEDGNEVPLPPVTKAVLRIEAGALTGLSLEYAVVDGEAQVDIAPHVLFEVERTNEKGGG